ncbi:hypothetical protein DIURU_001383 [Diutina rugosa]|uniref:Palmitoyltransferase n=1 Tax=Diutina rugosa TaxID=5481 RepID=A0A642UUM6_DIURU|nr:uncharacterized protein DIURU_001383 [Diutina rugosa]KAA8905721.1 hypothetical protein DIURU_001383 [Diutina rugosa]
MNDSLAKRTTASSRSFDPESLTSSSVAVSPAVPKPSWLVWFVTNWLVTDPELYERYNLAKRSYQTNQTRYIYICGGRWRSAKQKPINVACGVLIVAPGVLFFIFEASWMWHHINAAIPFIFAYLWLATLSFFLRSSMSDPGAFPKNIHLPQTPYEKKITIPDEYENIIKLPWIDRTKGVTVKYCPTCKIWRPPRVSHCASCDICVINHDHHCVFLNNCVGKRNYRYFLWFLLSAVVTTLFMAIMSFVHIFWYLISDNDTHTIKSFGGSLSKYPVSFLLVIYGILASGYPLLLLVFHLFLTAQNLTTREYLNYVRGDHDPDFINVYNTKNVLSNWYDHWIRSPRGVSVLSSTHLINHTLLEENIGIFSDPST